MKVLQFTKNNIIILRNEEEERNFLLFNPETNELAIHKPRYQAEKNAIKDFLIENNFTVINDKQIKSDYENLELYYKINKIAYGEEIKKAFSKIQDYFEEETNKKIKKELKKRFKNVFDKKCRLLAIQLNGFSHKIFFDTGANTPIQIKEYSHYTTTAATAIASIFKGFYHSMFQNNPKEIVYISPQNRNK